MMTSFWHETAKRGRRHLRETPIRLLRMSRARKRVVLVAVDTLLCFTAVFVAFSLRVGALSFPLEPPLIFAAVSIPLFILVFFVTRVYSTIVRFIGARSIFQLAKATFLYSIPLIAIFMVLSEPGVPRTIAILQPVLFFGFAATVRVVARSVFMGIAAAQRHSGGSQRVLIYGAGQSGKQLATALRHDPRFDLSAYLDDDPLLDRQQMDGVPIFHSSRLAHTIEGRGIDVVLLALPEISRKRRQEIVEALRVFPVHVKILPNLQQLVSGNISIGDLREVQIEDLLGRGTVPPNQLLLGRTVVGKTVLVTGAGGSIGSELCRQIVAIGPRRLVLFDVSEFALYQIDRELADWCAANDCSFIEIAPVLASVSDPRQLAYVFDAWRPDTVFHAAAYKHVPLVEQNPVEAIRNNVIGTLELVRAADRSGVEDFIQISTDKAVRPTNVMGATKRAAEQIVQAFAAKSQNTRYSIVRFGNVLGSSGSVVPLFRRQIEAGGPITLTHKAVTRYFMTIPEAAQLVLQAAGLARGGEVFVLDMGEPVKIASLARSMVELSGLTVRDADCPEGDIEIVEVGLRPGEKLYEELLIGNSPQATRHKQIMMAREGYSPWSELASALDCLAGECDRDAAIDLLRKIVPEFVHRRDNLPTGAVAGADEAVGLASGLQQSA
jgi:FlaA1/EpsC-like NDP-sugar epimerase